MAARTSLVTIATLAVAISAASVGWVAPAQEPMAFEVASVRPNNSGPGPSFIRRQPGGSLAVGNVTLRDLIMFAYGIQRFQLVAAPEWIANERFDITARAGRDLPPAPPGGTVPETLMLRALLVERFNLAIHRETRELPMYALVLARNDGQLGPQLRRSQTDCDALRRAFTAAGGAPLPMGSGGRPLCGSRGGLGTMVAGGLPMSAFPDFLTGHVQRRVIDRTGLTGTWDVDLTFAPDPLAVAPDPAASALDPTRPSLFTALQEQLGLRLEPIIGPAEVLVIDHVERPAPD